MKRLLACLAILTSALAGGTAYPCGASFGSNIKVDPHQDIIVAWKDGLETYAFQPTFCGSATDFGLILPIPAKLTQAPALIDQRAFIRAAAISEPNKKRVIVQQGGGCGGTTSASKGQSADEATVVASGRVGMLDWSELKAETESSFTSWLDANGYPHSPAASTVFSYYVQKGWYFVAFRISQEAVQEGKTVCRSLGPVALSFSTPSPVIPSRMASADNPAGGARVSWRIFGITPGNVQLSFAAPDNYQRILWFSGTVLGADVADLAGLAAAGDRLTRLALVYTGPGSSDVELKLDPAQNYRGTEEITVYDETACSLGPGQGSFPGALVLLFGLAILRRFFRRRS